jgi:hypothetical protein
MRTRRWIAVALLATACSSIRPAPVQVGDRCFRCKRVISDVRVAAEYVDQMNVPVVFRSSGCMAKYLHEHPAEQATVFVTDYKTGRMIAADGAWFVPTQLASPDGRAPEDDYLAFASRTDAQAAAGRATIVRWQRVLVTAAD